MFDVVAVRLNLEPSTMRCIMVWICCFDAVMIGPLLAFAVTDGAGISSPLAVFRLAHRFFLCVTSLALAYIAAYIVGTNWTPNGPILIFFITITFTIAISGIRHWMGPVIKPTHTWTDVWKMVTTGSRELSDHIHFDTVHGAR
jgi:hypothetical protein